MKDKSDKLVQHLRGEPPYFSICIPQWNRTSFLLEVLKSITAQDFKDYEICISDDNSPDGRQQEVIDFLQKSGCSFSFLQREKNGRYDVNLRSAMSLARGKFCFLLGNDDVIAGPQVLGEFKKVLEASRNPGVVVSNFTFIPTKERVERIHQRGELGAGPEMAAQHFRNLSFVSGVVLDRGEVGRLATNRWDGSEMYQMYLGCRMVAEGKEVVGLPLIAIDRCVQIPSETINTHATNASKEQFGFHERELPFHRLIRVVSDGVVNGESSLGRDRVRALNYYIARQVYLYTYVYWLFEYRKVASWGYSFGVARGMRPRKSLAGVDLSRWQRLKLRVLLATVTTIGLFAPTALFYHFLPRLHRIAKRQRSPQKGA